METIARDVSPYVTDGRLPFEHLERKRQELAKEKIDRENSTPKYNSPSEQEDMKYMAQILPEGSSSFEMEGAVRLMRAGYSNDLKFNKMIREVFSRKQIAYSRFPYIRDKQRLTKTDILNQICYLWEALDAVCEQMTRESRKTGLRDTGIEQMFKLVGRTLQQFGVNV